MRGGRVEELCVRVDVREGDRPLRFKWVLTLELLSQLFLSAYLQNYYARRSRARTVDAGKKGCLASAGRIV